MRYLTDCIRGEYWDRVLVRHPELRMYNTVVKKFEFFQAQVRFLDSADFWGEMDFNIVAVSFLSPSLILFFFAYSLFRSLTLRRASRTPNSSRT